MLQGVTATYGMKSEPWDASNSHMIGGLNKGILFLLLKLVYFFNFYFCLCHSAAVKVLNYIKFLNLHLKFNIERS